MAGVFDSINDALAGKTQPASGANPLNKKGYGGPGDMSPREAAMAKMKALGLSGMPDGGQEQLDSMWAAHVKKVNGAK